jgi:hypothetical protein
MIIEDLEGLEGYKKLGSYLIKTWKYRETGSRILYNKNNDIIILYSTIFLLFISYRINLNLLTYLFILNSFK